MQKILFGSLITLAVIALCQNANSMTEGTKKEMDKKIEIEVDSMSEHVIEDELKKDLKSLDKNLKELESEIKDVEKDSEKIALEIDAIEKKEPHKGEDKATENTPAEKPAEVK